MGRMLAVHRLSRWLPWVTPHGEIIQFKMPSKVHEELALRLVRLVRERERVGRLTVSPAEATAAMQVAIALVLCHGGDMRSFFVDRRAMSREGTRIAANLNLGEWMLRRAREILEAVGFISRLRSPCQWQRYDIAEGHHPERARRKPTEFTFGADFLSWLSFAVRKVRFAFRRAAAEASSQIQGGFISDRIQEGAGTTPSPDRVGHLGEPGERQAITVALQPRWRRNPGHRAAQIPIPGLSSA